MKPVVIIEDEDGVSSEHDISSLKTLKVEVRQSKYAKYTVDLKKWVSDEVESYLGF